MQRFGQFIRQTSHFGKSSHHVNPEHQIRERFPAWESNASRDGNLVSADGREREMIDTPNKIEARRVAALVFAFLAGMSAVSTAVAPAIMHI
jgi:hypothetical protein